MNIQWYPGHMTKTRRQIQADLKLVDLVAEVIDARIPVSSRNPDLDELVGEKPRLIGPIRPILRGRGPGAPGFGSGDGRYWRPTPGMERVSTSFPLP